jgi:hypothetical protein
MADQGEKLGGNPQIDQPTGWGLCWESSFSGTVTLLNSFDDFTKGLS